MDLDGVADELYGLPPEQFIASRTEREKQARAAGDRELAARIRQLGKPTAVAWLANQLVRARRTEIEPLLELGAGLRAASATLDGAQLRELDKQQHQLVYVLVQQARRLATAAGRPVSEDTARGLESTLHAALADSDAADQLAGARLTDALDRPSGFPPAGTSPRFELMPTGRAARTDAALRTSLGRGDPPKRAGSKAERADRDEAAAAAGRKAETERRAAERRAAELELARRAEQRAQATARDADETRDRARSAAERADASVREAAATVDRLHAELDAAGAEHSRLEQEHSRSQAELDAAAEAAAVAAHRLDEATERRRHLSR